MATRWQNSSIFLVRRASGVWPTYVDPPMVRRRLAAGCTQTAADELSGE